jgi:aspartate/methionine/tyrosine aminotransferase
MLAANNSVLLQLLSDKGKSIYFPSKGILKQSSEAKGKRFNATIGVAFDEKGEIFVLDEVAKSVDLAKDDIVKYASSFGKDQVRNLWKKEMVKKNPSLKNKMTSLPVVTSGLTHALFAAAYLFVDPGDRIICPNRFWGNYKLIFEHGYQGHLDTFEMFNDDDFNIEGLEEKLSSEGTKKIVFLNFPNNPTGYCPTREVAAKIVEALSDAADAGKNIVVLIDDAYFGLNYRDDVFAESIFTPLADLSESVVAVKVDGSTKEDFAWGLRVGFLTLAYKGLTSEAAEALESKIAGIVRGSISSSTNLSQSLLYKAITSSGYQKQKDEVYKLLRKRYERVQEILEDHQEYSQFFTPMPFNSGYFMCVELLKCKGDSVRNLLLDKYDTGVIAIDNLLRIAYSSVPREKLDQLFQNIYKACKEIAS